MFAGEQSFPLEVFFATTANLSSATKNIRSANKIISVAFSTTE